MESAADKKMKRSVSKDVPWFSSDLTEVDASFRALLENYSRIAPDLVKPHILSIVSGLPVNL